MANYHVLITAQLLYAAGLSSLQMHAMPIHQRALLGGLLQVEQGGNGEGASISIAKPGDGAYGQLSGILLWLDAVWHILPTLMDL